MGLIAISVLFLFYVPSFTLTFTRDHCMHFNKAMSLWGRLERHIYSGVVQRPTLKWHDANTPTEVALWLQPASVLLFLRPFNVQSNIKISDNKPASWDDYSYLTYVQFHVLSVCKSLSFLNFNVKISSISADKHFNMNCVWPQTLKNVILKALLVFRSYTPKVMGQNWTRGVQCVGISLRNWLWRQPFDVYVFFCRKLNHSLVFSTCL